MRVCVAFVNFRTLVYKALFINMGLRTFHLKINHTKISHCLRHSWWMISQRYASFAHFYGTMAKFRQLQALAAKVQLADEHDRWVVLDSTIIFNVSSAYKSLIGDGNGCATLNWILKGCCHAKHKVLCWLLIHNRLNTRTMLQRKHFFMNNYTCIRLLIMESNLV
jgi:hypothetical protein